jgi:hypothetical protein
MRIRSPAILAALVVTGTIICSVAQAAQKAESPDGRLSGLSFFTAVPGNLSYQGYLTDAVDSSAVTDTLEMTFRLFDSETKGAELWSETHPAVVVSRGLFQALLGSQTSFPAGLFDGTPLWLETEIAAEVLVPRKMLASTAYSYRSNSAEKLLDYTLTDLDIRWVEEEDLNHLNAADGDPVEVVWADDEGKVGIGKKNPAYALDVNGEVIADAFHGDGSNLTGIVGASPAWALNNSHVYSTVSGNVGIGTDTPTAKLHVIAGSGNKALLGGSDYGVYGSYDSGIGNHGWLGGQNYGAYGKNANSGNYAYLGGPDNAVYGKSDSGWAAFFEGNVKMDGLMGIGTDDPQQELDVEGLGPQIRVADPYMPAEYFTLGADGEGFSIGNESGQEPFQIRYGAPDQALVIDENGNMAVGGGSAQAGLAIQRDQDDVELRLKETGTDSLDNAKMVFDTPAIQWSIEANVGTGEFQVGSEASTQDAFGATYYWRVDEYKTSLRDNVDVSGDLDVGGDLTVAGAKGFAQEDPADPSRAIVYVCLEGPEAGTYQRGSADLAAGRATIDLPDHFATVTADQDLTIQLTPVGEWLELYVVEKSTSRIVVAEASGREGRFDYLVQGVRRGYEDYQVVRDRDEVSALDR